ncbi:hypothetical protein P879_07715 [Paragonimus westermani]|uniref:Uncharacterized protein n=1 Tax=Paragonimus westermani TaxID=34504 RepID=A0A8T0DG65_9TREM|nr:hypothetical protein P879_07715 [Paragonimus westermani]
MQLSVPFFVGFGFAVNAKRKNFPCFTKLPGLHGSHFEITPNDLRSLIPNTAPRYSALPQSLPQRPDPPYDPFTHKQEVVHHLVRTDHPTNVRPRRLLSASLEAAKAEFSHTLQLGAIRLSNSGWPSKLRKFTKYLGD